MLCTVCAAPERISGPIAICTACGLGRTLEACKPASEQDYVQPDEMASRARARYFGLKLQRLPPQHSLGRALDVGCAGGQLVRMLAARGYQAEGLDAFASGEGITTGELAAFEPGRRFSLVTSVHSFEHLPDPVGSARKLFELLEPGGQLLLAVPNFGGAWSRLGGDRWPWLNVSDHCYHYTENALTKLLGSVGFKNLATSTDSSEAGSALHQVIERTGLYNVNAVVFRPLRSLVYRAAELTRQPLNRLFDVCNAGAELVAIAQRPRA